MELRWLIRRNTVTDQQVRDYAERMSITWEYAKKVLQREEARVLQYNERGCFEQPDWKDVPTVVLPHED